MHLLRSRVGEACHQTLCPRSKLWSLRTHILLRKSVVEEASSVVSDVGCKMVREVIIESQLLQVSNTGPCLVRQDGLGNYAR